jgi:hypothetical protein
MTCVPRDRDPYRPGPCRRLDMNCSTKLRWRGRVKLDYLRVYSSRTHAAVSSSVRHVSRAKQAVCITVRVLVQQASDRCASTPGPAAAASTPTVSEPNQVDPQRCVYIIRLRAFTRMDHTQPARPPASWAARKARFPMRYSTRTIPFLPLTPLPTPPSRRAPPPRPIASVQIPPAAPPFAPLSYPPRYPPRLSPPVPPPPRSRPLFLRRLAA